MIQKDKNLVIAQLKKKQEEIAQAIKNLENSDENSDENSILKFNPDEILTETILAQILSSKNLNVYKEQLFDGLETFTPTAYVKNLNLAFILQTKESVRPDFENKATTVAIAHFNQLLEKQKLIENRANAEKLFLVVLPFNTTVKVLETVLSDVLNLSEYQKEELGYLISLTPYDHKTLNFKQKHDTWSDSHDNDRIFTTKAQEFILFYKKNFGQKINFVLLEAMFKDYLLANYPNHKPTHFFLDETKKARLKLDDFAFDVDLKEFNNGLNVHMLKTS